MAEHSITPNKRRFWWVNQNQTNGYSLIYDREGGKLAKHGNKYLVSLRPDFQIQYKNRTLSIMDAKWKRLKMSNSGSGMVKDLSNADLYQLFAYAMKILPDGGELFLIYPKSSEFTEPMLDIELSDRHKLSVVPFDLVTGDLRVQELFLTAHLSKAEMLHYVGKY